MSLSSLKRVVIVEDQPVIRNDLENLLMNHHHVIVVGRTGSVKEALVIIPATQPDVIFLDINLSDGTGFDILRELSPLTFKVIFLTAYQEHAIRAIKYGALDYLLKPINTEELAQALEKLESTHVEQVSIAGQQYHLAQSDRLVIHSQQYLHIIELADIVYCHGDAGYTTFNLRDGKKVLASKHLKEYENLLPQSFFLRTHQSYLVNKRFIEKVHKRGYLVLKDGTQIPVSSRRKDFVSSFFK